MCVHKVPYSALRTHGTVSWHRGCAKKNKNEEILLLFAHRDGIPHGAIKTTNENIERMIARVVSDNPDDTTSSVKFLGKSH